MMRYFKPLKSNVLEHNLIYSNNILLNHHHLQSVFILFLSMSGVLYWFLEMLKYIKQPLPLRSLLSNRKNKHEQIIVTWYARWTQLSDFTLTFHFHALEKEMATHCSVLAWRIPGMEEPGGLPSLGLHRVGHDWSDLAVAAAATSFFERLLTFGGMEDVSWLSCMFPATALESAFLQRSIATFRRQWYL